MRRSGSGCRAICAVAGPTTASCPRSRRSATRAAARPEMLMCEVAYLTAADVDSAIAALSAHENAMLLAGGTNVVDYLRAGVISPSVLIDISAVPLAGVHAGEAGFTIGGLARMSDVAPNPGMRALFPVVSQALELSASAQLRDMATLGGNLMQRTPCGYLPEPRVPGH